MKGNTGAEKNRYAASGIKVLSTLLIFGALCAGCASKESDEALMKTQNNVVEIDNRIAAIEGRVQSLGQEVEASQSRVYDVYYKSGKKTGMTARPLAQTQASAPGQVSNPVPGHASTQVPVAYASPISNTPMPAAAPKPVATPKPAPVATKSAVTSNPAIPASAQHAIIPQDGPPKAPMGSLDPNTKMDLKAEANTAAPAPVQELSLPPETAMYVPSTSEQAIPAAQPIAPATNQAPMPPENPVMTTASLPPAAPVMPHVASAAPIQPVQPVQATKQTRPLSQEKAAYKNALDLVRGGQATAGRAQFEAFLQAYPQSSLVPNAYYWIGESYYSQGNFTNALYAFKQVTTHFPKHHKTSDALLKAGMTYQKLGDAANAQMQYRAILTDFPNSNAAKIARNKRF